MTYLTAWIVSTNDMLDLTKHIVEHRSPAISIPTKFEDHYEAALQELLAKKQKGLPIAPARKSAPGNVVNLMEALRASIKGESGGKEKPLKPKAPAKPRPAAKQRAG